MSEISATAAIAYQISLLILSLSVIITRVYVRLNLEGRYLGLPDYLTATGWLLTLGWVICTAISFQLGALDTDEDETSIPLLKVWFASNFFFDIGLFFPKFSILAFYWNLIPAIYRNLRRALYLITVYVCMACVCAIGLDTFWCYPISNNWDPDSDVNAGSTWNSWVLFRTNYSFNLSADILVFILPFFILPHLKLPPRQRKSLIGVFSLGLTTMIISISRFTWENLNLDVASGDVWCTAELCVALIVVSLPSLKTLLRDRSHEASHTTSDPEMGSGSAALVRPRVSDMEISTQIRSSWYKQM